MSGEFDPYHKWLGISPREQPPNHYRLLAIDLFEDDLEVIDSAANRQMSYLQELASGPNVRHAQNLLNEISGARVCLLDEKSKAKYDAALQAEVAARDQPPPSPPPVESTTALPPRPSTRQPASPPPRDRGPQIDTGRGLGIAIDTRAKTAPRRSDTQRAAKTVGRPKSKSAAPIIVSAVLLVVVICAGIVFGVVMARSSNDTALAQQSSDSSSSPAKLNHQENDTRYHRQTPSANVSPSPIPAPSSDIPEPGSNVQPPVSEPPKSADDNSSTETTPPGPDPTDQPKVSPEDPPKADPPANKPSIGGPPKSLKQAYEALQRKNIEQVIALLEKCVADNPPPPYKVAAENLLTQAKTAISEDAAKKALRAWARKLTDQQVQDIANGKPFAAQLAAPVQHPILVQIFLETAKQHSNSVILERLNGNIPDDQVAANDEDNKPKDNEKPPAGNDPEPEKTQPAPRPMDPAELLAAEGLTKEGGRWTLAEMEVALKAQLTKVNSVYKDLIAARRLISQDQRQKLALVKRKLIQDQSKLAELLADWQKRGSIPKNEADDIKEKEAAAKELQKKIDEADEKLRSVDSMIEAAVATLKAEVHKLEEQTTAIEENYARLENDQEVLKAIEAQGGNLSRDTVVKVAKARVLTLRREFGEDDG